MLFTSEGRSVLGKTVPSEYPRPWAQFFPIRTSRLVNNIYLLLGSGPTSQSLTSFSNPEIRTWKFTENENYNSYTIKTKRPSSVLFLPAKKYRKHLGCDATLLVLTEQWKKELDNHKIIGLVSMDLSRAFDTLPYDLIVSKLR